MNYSDSLRSLLDRRKDLQDQLEKIQEDIAEVEQSVQELEHLCDDEDVTMQEIEELDDGEFGFGGDWWK